MDFSDVEIIVRWARLDWPAEPQYSNILVVTPFDGPRRVAVLNGMLYPEKVLLSQESINTFYRSVVAQT